MPAPEEPSSVFGAWATRLAPFCLAAGLSVLVLLTSRNVLLQAGGLDAFFYTSYIQDFVDLAERFGVAYYSTRVAHIFPAAAVVRLLGAEHGYVAHRLILLTGIILTVYALVNRHYGVKIGALMAMLAAFHPAMLRLMFWDEYENSAILYLLIIYASTFMARPGIMLPMAAAGSAYALAVNCNSYLLGVGSIPFLSYSIVYLRKARWTDAGKSVFAALLGFLATYASICLMRYWMVPSQGYFFDSKTVEFSMSMLGGLGRTWHNDVFNLVTVKHYLEILSPLAILAAGITLIWCCKSARKPIVYHAVLCLGLTVSLFIVIDFGYQIAVISLFYYFVYLYPSCLVVLAVIFGETSGARQEMVTWKTVFSITLAVLATHFLGWRLSEFGAFGWYLFFAALATLMAAAIQFTLCRRFAPYLAASGVILISLLYFVSPHTHYSAIQGGDPELQWDVYRASIRLQKLARTYPSANGKMQFWYSNNRGSLMNSVQSMFLWSFSRISTPDTDAPGMPHLVPVEVERIRASRYVCLLSEKRSGIDEGLRALSESGISVRRLKYAHSPGKKFQAHFMIVERLD